MNDRVRNKRPHRPQVPKVQHRHLDLRLLADITANIWRPAYRFGVLTSSWSWVLVEDLVQLRATVQVQFSGDDLASWGADEIACGTTRCFLCERWVEVRGFGRVVFWVILLITIYEKVKYARTVDEIVAEEQVQQYLIEILMIFLMMVKKTIMRKKKERN